MHILTGDWSIHVIKSQFLLLLYLGPDLYRVYTVGIGRQDRTPAGTFAITSKVVHPAWTPPGKHIPYGHPENILGTHWLGISPIGSTNPSLRGFGIHGTWDPDSIGTAASAGCVRMRNEESRSYTISFPCPAAPAPLSKSPLRNKHIHGRHPRLKNRSWNWRKKSRPAPFQRERDIDLGARKPLTLNSRKSAAKSSPASPRGKVQLARHRDRIPRLRRSDIHRPYGTVR